MKHTLYFCRLKDELPISPTDFHYFIYEDGSLEIFSTEATDEAEYTCQATNEAGEIEKKMWLEVLGTYIRG